jgi:protein SCO1/2
LRALRGIRYALWFAVATLAAFLGYRLWVLDRDQPIVPAFETGSPSIGGPFSLIDHDGGRVNDRSWPGQVLVVYFGFMHCPAICPTELQSIAAAVDALGPAGAKVQPLFVTIDPERDTPAALKEHVGLFHPRMIGLTGSAEEIAAVAKAYRVYYKKIDEPDSQAGYTMDHSGLVYVMDSAGKSVAIFRPGVAPEALAQRLKSLL